MKAAFTTSTIVALLGAAAAAPAIQRSVPANSPRGHISVPDIAERGNAQTNGHPWIDGSREGSMEEGSREGRRWIDIPTAKRSNPLPSNSRTVSHARDEGSREGSWEGSREGSREGRSAETTEGDEWIGRRETRIE